MRKTIMLFVTVLMLLPAIVKGQSSYSRMDKSCLCEAVLRILLSDKMFYAHLYYGMTDTIYISQNGLCSIPWSMSYTIQDKTVSFVLSDTKSFQDQDKIMQVWNISFSQNDKYRTVCEVEGLILNKYSGSEHAKGVVVLELKKRRGQYLVKKANCFYVVGKSY